MRAIWQEFGKGWGLQPWQDTSDERGTLGPSRLVLCPSASPLCSHKPPQRRNRPSQLHSLPAATEAPSTCGSTNKGKGPPPTPALWSQLECGAVGGRPPRARCQRCRQGSPTAHSCRQRWGLGLGDVHKAAGFKKEAGGRWRIGRTVSDNKAIIPVSAGWGSIVRVEKTSGLESHD